MLKSFIPIWLCVSVAKFSVTTISPEIWNGTPRDSFFSTTRNSRKKAGARAAAPTVVEALISVFQDALLSTDISQPIGMLGSAAILPEVMWIAKPTTRSLSLTCTLGMEIERVWRRASWLACENKGVRPAKATKPTAKNMNSFRLLFIWHRHGYVHSAYAECSDQLSESGRVRSITPRGSGRSGCRGLPSAFRANGHDHLQSRILSLLRFCPARPHRR